MGTSTVRRFGGAETRATGEAPVRAPRENHHLWRNGRLWWIAFTVRRPDGARHRIRRSLHTADVRLARWRRDRVLERYGPLAGCEVVARGLRHAS